MHFLSIIHECKWNKELFCMCNFHIFMKNFSSEVSMVLLNKITTLQAFQVKIYAVPDFLCSQCTVKEEAKMCSQWSFLGFYWLIYAPKISDWSNCISQYLERVPVGQIAWHSTHNELLLVKLYYTVTKKIFYWSILCHNTHKKLLLVNGQSYATISSKSFYWSNCKSQCPQRAPIGQTICHNIYTELLLVKL